MPPKAKSITTSSKSSTPEQTPVQFIKGVGPRLAAVFERRGIHTVRDLLTFFPRAYEDRTKASKVSELEPGKSATLHLVSLGGRTIGNRFGGSRFGKKIIELRGQDETGVITLKWFHGFPSLLETYPAGATMVVTGTPKAFMGRLEIIHPEMSKHENASDHGRVIPVYTEIEGVPTRTLRKILFEALQKYAPSLKEDLPEALLKKHGLPKLPKALQMIHFPETDAEKVVEFDSTGHHRFIYEEFFKFEIVVLKEKLRQDKISAPIISKSSEVYERALPYILTGDQKKALSEITRDLKSGFSMNRLLQGDVGSGKTAVALLSSISVLGEGGQVAFMAPTEILAEQHLISSQKLLAQLPPKTTPVRMRLLTGSSTKAERESILTELKNGTPLILFGTHALIEDPVIFSALDLVIIDEQHRFGVEQRRRLWQKGVRPDSNTGQTLHPHRLIVSATPIPRTLALTFYGDLTVSTLKEKPPGRTPIVTKVVLDQGRSRAFEKIRAEIKSGRQAYYICPLVDESEAEGFDHLKSAIQEADKLATQVFPEFKVGLLHGAMKSDEKAAVMERFKKGEIHILVSTTVIEVGVDVPNATVMAIEHAERFGLSQLHQLRGRVGRGSHASTCILFTHQRLADSSRARLDVLESTEDGFEIAEADLKIRGPGEFLGTRQAGSLPFKIADLARDQKWLTMARDDATALLAKDPELSAPETAPLLRFFEREGRTMSSMFKTS